MSVALDMQGAPPPVVRPRRVHRPWRNALLFALMVVIAIVMLYPFWFMIDTSLMSESSFIGSGGHSLASWRALDSTLPWGQELKNSALVCAMSIGIILVVSTMAELFPDNPAIRSALRAGVTA